METASMAEKYTCASCKGTFEKGQSDEDAAAELTETFGGVFVPEDCDVVCDDCFQRMMAWAGTEAGSTALAETIMEGSAANAGDTNGT
jgi:hypothetical protein